MTSFSVSSMGDFRGDSEIRTAQSLKTEKKQQLCNFGAKKLLKFSEK